MWLHSVADAQNDPLFRPDPIARPGIHVSLTTSDSVVRDALQQFIYQRYADVYHADVSHFLPFLLAAVSAQEIQAVLGLRPGSCGQFFVEQYLAEPVEKAISNVLLQTDPQTPASAVHRCRVIETGNLASLKGGSQRLFIVLTELLYQAGFDWVCFTATPQITALLQRLGFAPEVLAPASPSCLPDRGLSWGSYYDNKPNVLVGNVQKARQTLIRNELATRVLSECAVDVAAAVSMLAPFSQCEAQARG